MWRAIAFLCSAPWAALACDPGETRHFACAIQDGGKHVEICHDDHSATYRFGADLEAPELEIATPLKDVVLIPWPGIGRTIWEEVTFTNAGHTYTVFGSIDRMPDAQDDIVVTVSGGIVVGQGGKEPATLACDPGSVDFPWSTSLFDAKEAAGVCYDHSERACWACDPKTSR